MLLTIFRSNGVSTSAPKSASPSCSTTLISMWGGSNFWRLCNRPIVGDFGYFSTVSLPVLGNGFRSNFWHHHLTYHSCLFSDWTVRRFEDVFDRFFCIRYAENSPYSTSRLFGQQPSKRRCIALLSSSVILPSLKI